MPQFHELEADDPDLDEGHDNDAGGGQPLALPATLTGMPQPPTYTRGYYQDEPGDVGATGADTVLLAHHHFRPSQ